MNPINIFVSAFDLEIIPRACFTADIYSECLSQILLYTVEYTWRLVSLNWVILGEYINKLEYPIILKQVY